MILYPVWAEFEALVARLAATAAGDATLQTAADDAKQAFATAIDAIK